MAIRFAPGGWHRTHRDDEHDVLPPYLRPTELLHRRAAWPAIVVSLLHLPPIAPPVDAFSWSQESVSALVGVLGMVAAVGLLRRFDWSTPTILAVAVLNVLLGELAMLTGQPRGVVGVSLGMLTLALATPVPRRAPRY